MTPSGPGRTSSCRLKESRSRRRRTSETPSRLKSREASSPWESTIRGLRAAEWSGSSWQSKGGLNLMLRAMIFDVDGTLVDTNPAHVSAWRRAFARFGYDITAERIEVEIGKGGDKLVPSVLGEEKESSIGDPL